jgi:hypothetical protein
VGDLPIVNPDGAFPTGDALLAPVSGKLACAPLQGIKAQDVSFLQQQLKDLSSVFSYLGGPIFGMVAAEYQQCGLGTVTYVRSSRDSQWIESKNTKDSTPYLQPARREIGHFQKLEIKARNLVGDEPLSRLGDDGFLLAERIKELIQTLDVFVTRINDQKHTVLRNGVLKSNVLGLTENQKKAAYNNRALQFKKYLSLLLNGEIDEEGLSFAGIQTQKKKAASLIEIKGSLRRTSFAAAKMIPLFGQNVLASLPEWLGTDVGFLGSLNMPNMGLVVQDRVIHDDLFINLLRVAYFDYSFDACYPKEQFERTQMAMHQLNYLILQNQLLFKGLLEPRARIHAEALRLLGLVVRAKVCLFGKDNIQELMKYHAYEMYQHQFTQMRDPAQLKGIIERQSKDKTKDPRKTAADSLEGMDNAYRKLFMILSGVSLKP